MRLCANATIRIRLPLAPPVFEAIPVRLHERELPDGCDFYIQRQGVFRRIVGIRFQEHMGCYVGYVPGDTLKLVEMRPSHMLYISDQRLDAA